MKRILSIILFLTAALCGSAQTKYKMSAPSVNAKADEAFFDKMRAKMDSVRRAEKRPIVGLVLSGGGAKGAAHVGVIKHLEELGIPIDLVTGTSMGGLVGGLYALGYDADQLDSLLRSMDWDLALSDRVDPKYISYDDKMRRSRYSLSIPFHYSNKTIKNRREVHLEATEDDGYVVDRNLNTIASSLPSGYIFGLNVDNIIGGMSVGYQDSISFADLPVPFVCVATDVVSGRAKNWTSGSIQMAMRSTMAIPAMFDPVRYEDMVLVDGGTRNNFPTDIARAMGANIVIGVELSDAKLGYEQVNNIADMAGKMIDMLGLQAFEANVDNPDVFIKPDLTGYDMMSFSSTQIDTIIVRGYRAALEQDEELNKVLSYTRKATHYQDNGPKAIDLAQQKIKVSDVEFVGMDSKDTRYLKNKIKINPGDSVGRADLDNAMSKLYATRVFEAINYSMHEDGDAYRLFIQARQGPVHRMSLGLRADSEELVSVLLGVGLNSQKLRGSKLTLEARIGERWYGSMHYSISNPYLLQFNLDAKIGYSSADIIGDDGHVYDVGFWRHRESAYLSGLSWSRFDIKAGISYEHLGLDSWLTDGGIVVAGEDKFHTEHAALFGDMRAYTLDDKYYPSHGFTLGARLDWVLNKKAGIPIVAADFRGVIPVNSWFSIIPSAYTRNIIAENDDWSLLNFMGGSMQGRYFDQQMPFIGFHRSTILDDYSLVGNLDLRAAVAKNTYVSLQGGYVKSAANFKDMISDLSPTFYGFALELGYDSILGPIKANVHWSDFMGIGTYFGLGFDF